MNNYYSIHSSREKVIYFVMTFVLGQGHQGADETLSRGPWWLSAVQTVPALEVVKNFRS